MILISSSEYRIGQSEFLWYARPLPKVREAFSLIWNNDDLLVSYDGCGVFRPPEVNEEWRTQGAWYHIDQNLYNRSGLHAVQVSPPPYLYLSLSQVDLDLISFYDKIQGLVNFFPSGPYDGGFVVAPKSHLMNEEAFASIQKKKTEEREQEMGEVYK